MTARALLALLVALLFAACQPSGGDDTESAEGEAEGSATEGESEPNDDEPSAETPDPTGSPVTQDILDREPVTAFAMVQHVLISWDAMAPTYAQRGGQDPRGAERSLEDANALAHEVLRRARADEDFEALMAEYSEDPGSNESGRAYEVTEGARLVPPFKQLSLRLNEGEVGVVESDFGYHVIRRTTLDPAVSSEIMNREPVTQAASVRHILVSHEGNFETYMLSGGQDPRGAARSIEDVRTLVAQTLERINNGEDFVALMAELSEDPGSATTGRAYDVAPDAPLVPPFKHLSLRLNVDEVGVVASDFGFHIIQRVE